MAIAKARLPWILMLLPLALSACGGGSSAPKDLPDLQLVSMSLNPAHPTAGQPIEVTAIIRNIGTANAPATMSGVTVNGTQICAEIPTSALAIQQADTVACGIGALSTGTYGVGFCADVTSQADEPDESNNCALQMVEIGSGSMRP